MFPLRDVNPTRITPYLTLILIAANLFVFFGIQQRQSTADQERFLYEQAAIACELTTGDPLSTAEIVSGECSSAAAIPAVPFKNVLLSVLSSLFLHGGIAHVLLNMWFLWIFGNNVEEAFGRIGYLAMYLVGGVAATAAFVLLNADSTIPLVGASGAIAAVLGAYAVLFPVHKIQSFVGWFLIPVPAALFLGLWFVAQFGLGGTGVAWEAHVGGFVVGLFVALLFRGRLLERVG